ncbi:GspH/FimT family pseudopilin [Variovorax rhizosphaerae]|uniref:Type II secretion system protein H n=1 Tax=Variovorax rhizosphaerae TaxID=1836200 RepID=A0ABU8WCG6_9BURK
MRQRGFTLIELMTGITVLALILVSVMPSVANWLDNTRIRNAADSLQNGLQTARGEAIRRNQNMSFWLVAGSDPTVLSNDCTLSSASASWVVSINSPVAHCADEASTDSSPMLVVGRAAGGGQVTVSAVKQDGSAATTVTFDGFGRITNTDPIRTIDLGGTSTRNLRLMISAAGSVRLCDPSVSDNNDPRKCM